MSGARRISRTWAVAAGGPLVGLVLALASSTLLERPDDPPARPVRTPLPSVPTGPGAQVVRAGTDHVVVRDDRGHERLVPRDQLRAEATAAPTLAKTESRLRLRNGRVLAATVVRADAASLDIVLASGARLSLRRSDVVGVE